MKQIKHESRKSFKRWAMTGQRTESFTPKFINRTKRVVSYSIRSNHPPAFVGMIKGHNRLLPRNANRSRGVAKIASKGRAVKN